MTTRKRPNNDDENPKKRARIGGNVDSFCDTSVSFCSLPSDCKVHAFSFLPPEDMNSAACCNKECNEARNNESLDQQRTGTLVWKSTPTIDSFSNKLREIEDTFTGNRTCLKIEGLRGSGRMPFWDWDAHVQGRIADVCLKEVTSLDCSLMSPAQSDEYSLFALSCVLPNLIKLDVSGVTDLEGLSDFAKRCPNLTTITCNGELLNCGELVRAATCLYLDGITFSGFIVNHPNLPWLRTMAREVPDWYLLMNCSHMERVSLKGAKERESPREEAHPLSQEVLIKMVLRHPTLRWLRSDLSEENVAMLKQERPEITFVSD